MNCSWTAARFAHLYSGHQDKASHMNQKLFPKPAPADPLPLEVWLKRADRAESGREAFFRGRDAEYDIFRSAVASLSEGIVGNGTMVFQGAPGAGKSALMAECVEAVRCHSTTDDPWVAIVIKPDTLQSAVDVVMLLIEAANLEVERLSKMASGKVIKKLDGLVELGRKLYGELSERGVGVTGVSVGGKLAAGGNGDSGMLAERVFRNRPRYLKISIWWYS